MKRKVFTILSTFMVLLPVLSCSNKTENSEYLSSSEEELSISSVEGDSLTESSQESESDSMESETNNDISESKIEVSEDTTLKKSINDFNSTPFIDGYLEKGYESVYEDVNFKNGFIVTKSTYGAGESPYHGDYLRIYPSFIKPQWSIAQWNSRYDILGDTSTDTNAGYKLTREDDGLINTITSKGQEVNGEFLPGKVVKINSMTGEIYLESNCSIEYEQDRTGSEPWVHLLLANSWNKARHISELTSIVMEANFTINKCINYTGDGYNVNKHAAQLVWYITIQNLNRNSKGYGKYIWFGIGLWDDRRVDQIGNAYIAHDAGTDTLIYNPSSIYYYGKTNGVQLGVGKENNAYVDVYPIVERAFTEAQEKGYLADTTWEDLYIGGTNFGYEVPGTFDISASIHSLGVFVK